MRSFVDLARTSGSALALLVGLGSLGADLAACGGSSTSDPGADGDSNDANGSSTTGNDGGGNGTNGGNGNGNGNGNGDGGNGSDAGSDASLGTRPHPLYPPLDLDTLPGAKGGSSGLYQPPTLPTTTRTVNVTTTGSQARADLAAACATAGTAVTVPNGAGALGTVDLGNIDDCDITLGDAVVVGALMVGHLPGPTVAPVHRVRVRGGKLGAIAIDPGSTDIVFDGVTVDNAVVTAASRVPTAIVLHGNAGSYVDRFAFVNSLVRMVATVPGGGGETDGCAYLGSYARNVIFANDNVSTAGNRNAWGFRISGGQNHLFVDDTIRVAFHKLVRMNDGPVDYVYVKGGTWIRQASVNNDSFAQLEDYGTDHVYIHDPAVYLLSPQPVSFGATGGPGQSGKSWEARRIAWHARTTSVISDAILTNLQGACTAGAVCDYGQGTHTYAYDANIAAPANPWRSLPTLSIDSPDALPLPP